MSTYFTDDHEWITVEGDVATIGITDFAQSQLGDIVFIELPDIGKTLEKGDEAAVVESVKAASEVFAPIDGDVLEVNSGLEEDPALVNSEAEGKAWFIKVKIADASQFEDLMDADAYKAHVAEQG
ncbi:glycine cleavage system protein GcvH [Cohaesibacter celericrescens]|jgi:glycine cleavage system H protein|uniref:Glycine cleavage system H protein n=1 Tax=Cohaesibacter celericrescens TaxID=2067669 RepID=A0A2N5XKL0_9HYPH|nr:glycine cleavage system protein GcvH [Cohaesibacter celericrescens]PLW74970.1 glycine cleavage system protein H [Cohaesibacter celericrescens]